MRWDIKFAVLLFFASLLAGVAVMVAPDVLHLTDPEKQVVFWTGLAGASTLMLAAIVVALKGEVEEERRGRKARMLSLFGMIVCIIGFAGFAITYFWPASPVQPLIEQTDNSKTPSYVASAQFEELKKVETFFGERDELKLRELFDLTAIFKKNIDVQITRIKYIKSGHDSDFYYNNYTDNGIFIVWAKEGHYAVSQSGVNINAGPKDVLYLVTTSKFQSAQERINNFISSALIPDNIKNAIKDFNSALNKQPETMLQILDERMHEDEEYFISHLAVGSKYYRSHR